MDKETINKGLAIIGAAAIFGGILAGFTKMTEVVTIRVLTGKWAHNGQADLFANRM